MLIPHKMKQFRLIIHEKHLNDFLWEVQKAGIVEFDKFDQDLGFQTEPVPDSEIELFEQIRAELNSLPTNAPGIVKRFTRKPKVVEDVLPRNDDELLAEVHKLSMTHKKVIDELTRKLEALDTKESSIKKQILEVEFSPSEYHGVIKKKHVKKFKELVSHSSEGTALVEFVETPQPPTDYIGKAKLLAQKELVEFVLVIPDEELEQSVLRKLAGLGLIDMQKTKRIDELIETDEARIKQKKKTMIKLLEHLRIERAKALTKAGRLLNVYLDRKRVIASSRKTKHTYLMQGWVPEPHIKEFESIIDKSCEGQAFIEVYPAKPEKAPVLLNNPRILKPFERLTEMFGLPKYNELDPTLFLAISFVLFFGLMFADAGDGLILLLLAGLAYKNSVDPSTKDLAFVIMSGAGSAILFGALTGEFFGHQIGGLVHIFETPMAFMEVTIIIGIVQIVFGLVIGLVEQLRDKEFIEGLGDQFASLLILLGVAVFFIGYEQWGIWLIIASIIASVLVRGIRGPIELTKNFSNIVSYVRILALNMAHVGIGRTFTLIVDILLQIPVFGLLLAGATFVGTHIFIIFLGLFAAFAHSLRLHFVEFFSKFYRSGGRAFKPFKLDEAMEVIW